MVSVVTTLRKHVGPPSHRFTFTELNGRYAVCRLDAMTEIPTWAQDHEFVFVARTGEELSILLPADRVPKDVRAQRDLAGFRLRGVIDFDETGILAAVSRVLADASIPVFVVSTYDTDYFFVPGVMVEKTKQTLSAAGHIFQ